MRTSSTSILTFPAAILALCLAAFSLAAFAGVNPQNGDFFISYQDITQEKDGYKLNLKRTYNSKSSERGWFGYGWGTTYETRLVVTPDKSIEIHEAGGGEVVYYHPASTSSKTVWVADNCSDSLIGKLEDGYERVDCNGINEHFNVDGQLTHRQEGDDYSVNITYENGKPVRIDDTLGQTINFVWKTSGWWNKKTNLVEASNGIIKTLYTADGKGNLIMSEEVGGLWYKYDYDKHHNMTCITYIDNSTANIQYDSKNTGSVISFSDRLSKGAKTLYAYRSDPQNAKHTWTKITKVLDTGEEYAIEQEFEDRFNEHGTLQLASYAENTDSLKKHFDEKGRLSALTAPDGQTLAAYSYHPISGKLILAIEESLETSYRYDQNDNLTRVEKSNGDMISLEYNSLKTIKRIVDTRHNKTKRELTFKYNAAGLPTQINLVGTGTIHVRYDADGEIMKVTSSQGAKMSSMILEIFQNLLRTIKPETMIYN